MTTSNDHHDDEKKITHDNTVVAQKRQTEKAATTLDKEAKAENDQNSNTVKTTYKEVSLFGPWVRIEIPETLTLSDLGAFKNELETHLGQRVRLSNQAIQRIDTAAIQLLLTFINSPEVTVSWEDHSDKLDEVTRLLGLAKSMNLHS